MHLRNLTNIPGQKENWSVCRDSMSSNRFCMICLKHYNTITMLYIFHVSQRNKCNDATNAKL